MMSQFTQKLASYIKQQQETIRMQAEIIKKLTEEN